MTVWLLIVAAVLAIAVWFLYASRRLAEAEVGELAKRKRLRSIDQHFSIQRGQSPVNMDFKKTMPSGGCLFDIDEPVSDFPSLAAGLLKWKKHEWIIIGYGYDGRIVKMWMNKGPDREMVASFVGIERIAALAREVGADIVIDVHNHPNGTHIASQQDQLSAGHSGKEFLENGLTYLAFVARRGLPYEYACWVPDDLFPLGPLLSDVESANGTGRLTNYRLRRELSRRSLIEYHLNQPYTSENIGLYPTQRMVDAVRNYEKALDDWEAYTESAEAMDAPADEDTSMQQSPSLNPVQSSFLSAIGYDEAACVLDVAFRNGAIYRYFDFPASEYSALLSASSVGQHYNTFVANRYEFLRVQ